MTLGDPNTQSLSRSRGNMGGRLHGRDMQAAKSPCNVMHAMQTLWLWSPWSLALLRR
jgi:hypothetical protein